MSPWFPLWFAWTLLHPSPALQTCVNPPFQEGEMTRFEVSTFGVVAGEGTAILRKAHAPRPEYELSAGPPQGKVWHVKGRGLIAPPASWFYKLDDILETWMFPDTFLPHRRELWIDESSERALRRVIFDHGAGSAHFYRDRTYYRSNPDRVKVTERESFLYPQSFDVISLFQYLRCVSVTPGDRIKVFVFENGKNRFVGIRVVGTEPLDTIFGTIDTVHAEITVYPEGKLVKGRPFKGWISNDERRVPIKFVVDLRYAHLKGELKGYRRNFKAPIVGELDPSFIP